MQKRASVPKRTNNNTSSGSQKVDGWTIHPEGTQTTAQVEATALKYSNGFSFERRNGQERRKKPSSGFTCISIVGWICRREQIRRKEEPDCFTTGEL